MILISLIDSHLISNQNLYRSGIIPSMHISGVVTDGRFSSLPIKDTTQVVLMEEWTSNSLSCEEAKRTLQGTNYFGSLCMFIEATCEW